MKSLKPTLSRLLIIAVLIPLAAMLALAVDGLTDETPVSDVAVVLGNQVHPDGTPSPRLTARLDRVLQLWREDKVSAIIVSGGTGREGWPEAQVMKSWLIERGVPASAVIADDHGVDTWATAANASSIMQARGWDSAIVVSQFFHVPRSRLAFARHGVPTGGTHPDYFEPRDLYSLIREVPAYAKYALRRAPPVRPRPEAASTLHTVR